MYQSVIFLRVVTGFEILELEIWFGQIETYSEILTIKFVSLAMMIWVFNHNCSHFQGKCWSWGCSHEEAFQRFWWKSSFAYFKCPVWNEMAGTERSVQRERCELKLYFTFKNPELLLLFDSWHNNWLMKLHYKYNEYCFK